MENRPTISISAIKVKPEYEERHRKWRTEVYHPLLITVPGVTGIDSYQIVKQNPQYQNYLQINAYANRSEMVGSRNNQKYEDVVKDFVTTWASRSDLIWRAAYEPIKTFRSGLEKSEETVSLRIEDAPIMHMEGYSFSPNDRQKYEAWFTKWGYELYVPLLMKLPGLKQYSWYRSIDVESTGLPDYYKPKRPVEYPPYLSILHFENLEAYEHYEKSIELAGFRDHMNLSFPEGLDFKWYVQYQLIKSFRK